MENIQESIKAQKKKKKHEMKINYLGIPQRRSSTRGGRNKDEKKTNEIKQKNSLPEEEESDGNEMTAENEFSTINRIYKGVSGRKCFSARTHGSRRAFSHQKTFKSSCFPVEVSN